MTGPPQSLEQRQRRCERSTLEDIKADLLGQLKDLSVCLCVFEFKHHTVDLSTND